jgi:hypothetical protein
MIDARDRRRAVITLPLFVLSLGAHGATPCDARWRPAQRSRSVLALADCDATAPGGGGVVEPPPEAGSLQRFETSGPVVADVLPIAPAPVAPALHRRALQPPPESAGPARAAPLRAIRLAPEIDAVARRHDLDPLLLHAIAWVESRHDPQAVSRAGARGLLQLMPATAARYGVGDSRSLADAALNLDVGASHLKALQRRFGDDLELVLAAYNAGEARVERSGRRVPPIDETRDYVRRVLAQYRRFIAVAEATALR